MRIGLGTFIVAAVALAADGGGAEARVPALTAEAINSAPFAPLPEVPSKRPAAEVVRAAVLLDRARFSPGAIDGIDGDNLRKAVAAYQAVMDLPVSGRLDQATWNRLTSADKAPVVVERKITPADLKGPFAKHIPKTFEEQAALEHLSYVNVVEELSEQVHASPALLRSLNPRARWNRPDEPILVPQVVVNRGAPVPVSRITVDKPGHAVLAYGPDGRLAAVYPASIGSAEKPAPSGQATIARVIHNPDYTYNPKYAFKGVKATKPFKIAPGPNNPVGSVWMDLSFEGYGLHGTPEPDLVGKTQSHGCIRLTNWDAEDLASMVRKNTPVLFSDQPVPLKTPAPTPSPAAPAAAAAPVQTPASPPQTQAVKP